MFSASVTGLWSAERSGRGCDVACLRPVAQDWMRKSAYGPSLCRVGCASVTVCTGQNDPLQFTRIPHAVSFSISSVLLLVSPSCRARNHNMTVHVAYTLMSNSRRTSRKCVTTPKHRQRCKLIVNVPSKSEQPSVVTSRKVGTEQAAQCHKAGGARALDSRHKHKGSGAGCRKGLPGGEGRSWLEPPD